MGVRLIWPFIGKFPWRIRDPKGMWHDLRWGGQKAKETHSLLPRGSVREQRGLGVVWAFGARQRLDCIYVRSNRLEWKELGESRPGPRAFILRLFVEFMQCDVSCKECSAISLHQMFNHYICKESRYYKGTASFINLSTGGSQDSGSIAPWEPHTAQRACYNINVNVRWVAYSNINTYNPESVSCWR